MLKPQNRTDPRITHFAPWPIPPIAAPTMPPPTPSTSTTISVPGYPITTFTPCAHTTPPTPRPSRAIKPTISTHSSTNTGTSTTTQDSPAQSRSYPFPCFHCDVSARLANQEMILSAYRRTFREFHLLIAQTCNPRESSGFFIDDLSQYSQDLEAVFQQEETRRDQDIDRVWAGFLERWWRPICFGGAEGPEMVRIRLVRQLHGDGQGGLDVQGPPAM